MLTTRHRASHSGSALLSLFVGAALLVGCESTQKPPFEPPAADIKSAGIENFPRIAAKVQQEPVWCWAACAEMILVFYGQPATQQAIVDRVHGEIARRERELTDEYNRPRHGAGQTQRIVQAATMDEILWAMNPDMQSMREKLDAMRAELQSQRNRSIQFDLGSLFSAEMVKFFSKDSDVIVESLVAGQPAIFVAGSMDGSGMGHAEVAYLVEYIDTRVAPTGSTFGLDQVGSSVVGALPFFDTFKIVRLHSVDPANGQTRTYTGEEVKQFGLYVTKQQAREILQKRLNAVGIAADTNRGGLNVGNGLARSTTFTFGNTR